MADALALGTMVGLGPELEAGFAQVRALGLRTCQLACWNPSQRTPALARTVRAQARAQGIEISSFWAGHSGAAEWNFTGGPGTIGLVPPATRATRVAEYEAGAAFAAAIGAPSLTTHAGFLPEHPGDPAFPAVVGALATVAQACQRQGIGFWFETGQETPIALVRVIRALGMDHVGINLDPANLILYGKGNPVDAVGVFGGLVRGMHAKDGRYPTDPAQLGHETPLGEGQVDFPALLRALRQVGYSGCVTIEREITGEQQRADILRAIAFLRPLLAGSQAAASPR